MSGEDTDLPAQSCVEISPQDEFKTNFDMEPSSSSPVVSPPTTLRQEAGQALAHISDTINKNIITARYATIFSVSALTIWGISMSPIFFRFKRITDIPMSYFQQRRTIPCRIVQIANPISKDLSNSGMIIFIYKL